MRRAVAPTPPAVAPIRFAVSNTNLVVSLTTLAVALTRLFVLPIRLAIEHLHLVQGRSSESIPDLHSFSDPAIARSQRNVPCTNRPGMLYVSDGKCYKGLTEKVSELIELLVQNPIENGAQLEL